VRACAREDELYQDENVSRPPPADLAGQERIKKSNRFDRREGSTDHETKDDDDNESL
jgi:hypothetical protein